MSNMEKYLNEIGIAEPIKESIYNFIEIGRDLSSEEIIDIFISEYKTDYNVREFESIWIFTNTYLMEVKKFRTSSNIDMVNRLKGFDYLAIDFKDYDYISNVANVDSKMSIEARVNQTESFCIFKASESNCQYLKKIIEKYFKKII